MSQLKNIAEKALEIAKNTTDLEQMERAIQIEKAVREITEQQAEKPWIRRSKDLGPVIANYVAVLAFLLSMSALIFQFYQFRKTIEQQEATFIRTQWREALKNVSIKDDSAVLSSALEMESFFREPEYAKQSRSQAIALLPLLGRGDQADSIWESMLTFTKTRDDLLNLISAAQAVAAEQTMLFRKRMKITGYYMTKDQESKYLEFIESPEEYLSGAKAFSLAAEPITGNDISQVSDQRQSSPREEKAFSDNEYARDQELNPLKRAAAAQWKINSITEGLVRLWRPPNPKTDFSSMDFKGVILDGSDFSGLDFSNAKLHGVIIKCNLSGTVLKDADLQGALIGGSSRFENSRWEGANWWEADLLSCELVRYLNEKYPAPPESTQRVDELRRTCVK